MTSPASLDADPPCPGTPDTAPSSGRALIVERERFGALDRGTWDALAAANRCSTPFSRWAFHRAWWDAYGDNAHEQTLVVREVGAPPDARPVAIVPLMHRHEVEPTDAAMHTTLRHGHPGALTPVAPTAKAVFFGASYHADYATVLAAPDDLPAVADAVAAHLADPSGDPEHPLPWDVVDLRRLRSADPAVDALTAAFGARELDEAWTVNLEREDVCPVVTLPERGSMDDYLATLGKKTRHEIRRKLRRCEDAGDTRLVASTDPLADLEAFIDLHQRRWGADGLFPPTAGGGQSRRFVTRLFELSDDDSVRLHFLTVGDRRVAAGITFETADTIYYYNAGVDPDARDLSPGVVLIARYFERALATGVRRFDFLRGDESYKYDWGAVDEPIQRLLVRRTSER